MALRKLNDIKGFHCHATQGAFYLFPAVSTAIKQLGLKDDNELAELLLEKAHVATVAGSAFGLENHLRLSYAVSNATLVEALHRIEHSLQ